MRACVRVSERGYQPHCSDNGCVAIKLRNTHLNKKLINAYNL